MYILALTIHFSESPKVHQFYLLFVQTVHRIFVLVLSAATRDRSVHNSFAEPQNGLQLHREQGKFNTAGLPLMLSAVSRCM